MIRFIHSFQIVIMIIVLAISFFITYDFFITHISFKNELFLISSIVIMVVAAIKYMLKLQFYFFVQNRVKQAEIKELINKEGKKRILVYESLVWLFLLATSLFQIKLFGISHSVTIAFLFAFGVDVFFWIVFNKKFKNIVFNGQIFLFNSRPDVVSLKNVKTLTKRYNDYYFNYTDGKYKLLKSDLIKEKIEERVNASF